MYIYIYHLYVCVCVCVIDGVPSEKIVLLLFKRPNIKKLGIVNNCIYYDNKKPFINGTIVNAEIDPLIAILAQK